MLHNTKVSCYTAQKYHVTQHKSIMLHSTKAPSLYLMRQSLTELRAICAVAGEWGGGEADSPAT
jgi:hypothetical protein